MAKEKLSEDEKNLIVEKIQFENTVRQELDASSTPSQSKVSSFLNSKMFTLLIGALITGILVPCFQYTQKSIEWKRQNQFDNINYRLGMMRDCLREFVVLQAYRAEAYEMVEPFLGKDVKNKKSFVLFEQQYSDLTTRLFKQNTKVTSLIISFTAINHLQGSGEDNFDELFKCYRDASTDYIRKTKELVQIKFCNLNPDECTNIDTSGESLERLKEHINKDINNEYYPFLRRMEEELRWVENENEKFRF